MERQLETPSVTFLDPADLDAAAAMLGRAFHDDPTSQYLFADPELRRHRVPWMMGCMARFGLRYGVVETVAPLRSAAAWVRSDVAEMTLGRMLRCGMWAAPVRMGLGRCVKTFRMARIGHDLRTRAGVGTHWYLMLLGVDPACQRMGLGSLLLRRGIERAEADGLPCYLETVTEDATRLYARHGFELVGQARIPDSEIDVRSMIRPPGSASY